MFVVDEFKLLLYKGKDAYKMMEEVRNERVKINPISTKSPTKKISIFKSEPKQCKDKCSKDSNEVLALPEAYLNRQISKDIFHRSASGEFIFSDKCGAGCSSIESQCSSIKVKDGIEEIKDNNFLNSDLIEEGTDPLDPSTSIESMITKSINIKTDVPQTMDLEQNKRISRSVDSYYDDDSVSFFRPSLELGSDPLINVSCDKTNSKRKYDMSSNVPVGQQRLLEQWLSGDTSSSDNFLSEECLRMSLQDISSPLKARTDKLLSTNQSFNLVKHRPVE